MCASMDSIITSYDSHGCRGNQGWVLRFPRPPGLSGCSSPRRRASEADSSRFQRIEHDLRDALVDFFFGARAVDCSDEPGQLGPGLGRAEKIPTDAF